MGSESCNAVHWKHILMQSLFLLLLILLYIYFTFRCLPLSKFIEAEDLPTSGMSLKIIFVRSGLAFQGVL